MTLPNNLIAGTLNLKARRIERQRHDVDDVPRMHVSSIIKAGPADFFCPREQVLRYMERRDAAGAGIPPKFALLYAVGHFYGEYVVNEFLRRNPEYAQYAWGDWSCRCGRTVNHQCFKPDGGCRHCNGAVDNYVETDLFNPAKTVIGHADLIFLYDGEFTVYEFKSIDRADVEFDEINEPLGDHLVQASNYYYMLRSMFPHHRINRNIRFVYVDRSMEGLYTQKPFREVEAPAIPKERLGRFYKKVKTVHSSIEKGLLPERLCEDIGCSRAKICTTAVSCFNRKSPKIKRIRDTW